MAFYQSKLQTDLKMDREDTAHGRGGGLLVYTREGILGAQIDKKVKFHQCSCFQVYDTTIYSVY